MARPLVAVMLGGPSSEHEISLLSGARVLEQLDRERYDAAPIFVDRQAVWHFGRRPWIQGGDWHGQVEAGSLWTPGAPGLGNQWGPLTLPSPPRGRGDLMPWRPDVVFIALHGTYGEDGQVQTLLEHEELRYTGSGPEASKVAMNKVAAKEVFEREGLPLARGWEVLPGESAEHAATRIVAEFAGPFVVKPRDGGSSVGVRMPDAKGLHQALESGLAEGEPQLVEERLPGVEITVGVLEELGGERTPQALPVTEIVPPAGGFFDYEAKYTAGVSQEITPARIDDDAAARAQSIALAAHAALGCRAYSRSDFILAPGRGPVLMELNTLPGMTATSLMPQGAEAVGMSYRELVTRIVELALR